MVRLTDRPDFCLFLVSAAQEKRFCYSNVFIFVFLYHYNAVVA